MDAQKRLARHLAQLNKAIRRVVARSKEFEPLRRFLHEEEVELAIYVVPIVKGKPMTENLRFELTEEDRKFLRSTGIRF